MKATRLDQAEVIDAMEEVFDGLYAVHLRNLDRYDPVMLQLVGVGSTGDKEWDAHNAESYTQANISIAEMADYYADNIRFYPINSESLPKIYQHVKRYLELTSRMFGQAYITPRHVLQDMNLAKVMHDLHRFVDLANYLRGAISWVNETLAEEEAETITRTTRLLNGLRYRRSFGGIEDDTPEEISSKPPKLDVETIMPENFQGQTRNWDIRHVVGVGPGRFRQKDRRG